MMIAVLTGMRLNLNGFIWKPLHFFYGQDVGKLKLDSCLSPYTSISSKWIEDLNVKPETLKLVEEIAGNIPELTGIGNNFLNRAQTTQQLRERIDKWDSMKLKASVQQKKWSPD
jgi:hypothetical protein